MSKIGSKKIITKEKSMLPFTSLSGFDISSIISASKVELHLPTFFNKSTASLTNSYQSKGEGFLIVYNGMYLNAQSGFCWVKSFSNQPKTLSISFFCSFSI